MHIMKKKKKIIKRHLWKCRLQLFAKVLKPLHLMWLIGHYSVSYVNQDIISLIHIGYINCEINNMMDLQILKTIRKLRS